jgi:hypothetical protein
MKEYRQFVVPTPRNFSAFVLFNNNNNEDNDEEFYCEGCKDAKNWFEHVSTIHFIQKYRRHMRQEMEDNPVHFVHVDIYLDNHSKVYT